jgi:putative oxidoreductase
MKSVLERRAGPFGRDGDVPLMDRLEAAMLETLVKTSDDVGLTAARLALGAVVFAHGAQKLLGWWGGDGLAGTLQLFTRHPGVPLPLALLAILAEFFGGLGLIAGVLARVAAFGIFVDMVAAAALARAPHGFFMNWPGSRRGEGLEYHLLAMALAAVVMNGGAGPLSVDRATARDIGR